MNDLISRQAAIDIERNATVDTNPSHFEAHQKFTQFMDDAEISSFGRWQWSNGFNTALTAVGIDLKKLPSAQPEPIKINIDPELTKDDYEKLRKDLADAPIVLLPECKTGRWIPVSERLPETIDAVNVTWINRQPESYYADIKDKPFTGTAHYCKGKWWWDSCVCQDYLNEYGNSPSDEVDEAIEIVAWMPLPEPYERKEE